MASPGELRRVNPVVAVRQCMRALLAFWIGVFVGVVAAGWFCVRVCVSLLDEDQVLLQSLTTTHPPVQASPAWWNAGPTRRRIARPEV